MGNFYDANIQMGRYDADFGKLLINEGKGKFSAQSLAGDPVRGQVRAIRPIQINGKSYWVIGRNSETLKIMEFKPLTI